MVVIYDSNLTEPPSSIHCFRDVTLYSKFFLNFDNIIKCPKGTRTLYWNWIKKYGAHDFIDDLILENEEESGIVISNENGNIRAERIDEFNYGDLINILKRYKI